MMLLKRYAKLICKNKW